MRMGLEVPPSETILKISFEIQPPLHTSQLYLNFIHFSFFWGRISWKNSPLDDSSRMENLGNECGLKANSNSKISSIVIARIGDSFSDVIILNFHSLRISIDLNKLDLTFYFFPFSKSFETWLKLLKIKRFFSFTNFLLFWKLSIRNIISQVTQPLRNSILRKKFTYVVQKLFSNKLELDWISKTQKNI